MIPAIHGIMASNPFPPSWLKMSPYEGVTLTSGKVSSVDVGDGFSAIQTVDGLRPTIATVGSFDVFRFNGANSLRIPALPLGLSCFFLVFKATANGIIMEHSTNAGANSGQFLYSTTGSTILLNRQPDSFSFADYVPNWGIDGTVKVVCFRIGVNNSNAPVAQFYVNSITPQLEFSTNPVMTITDTLFIGSRADSGLFITMDLALMQTYESLTDEQVAQKMTELMTAYSSF